jgi:fructose-bisphosphate aldolase class II
MPLVTEHQAVKDIYREAAERNIALPAFCCEDRETLEAILAAALTMSQRLGVVDLPIIPAWTCRYPPRAQMRLIAACGDPVLGTRLMFSDLETFMGDDSPYRKLRVLPHLDHAYPWLDGDILESFADRFASVMCDASEKPFEENIRLTAQYGEKVHGKVVVEGAVDEIYETGGGGKNTPTSVEQARQFLNETGVDILVPNVGTEHRATGEKARYLPEQARKISATVGNILCLHGTSSVPAEKLPALSSDGFVKINIYTTLAVSGGQAVARKVLKNVGNIFTEAQLLNLVQSHVLGETVLSEDYGDTQPPINPKLATVTNPTRRDAWFTAVQQRCLEFLEIFNYAAFQRTGKTEHHAERRVSTLTTS